MADEIIGRISVGDGATFTPSVSSAGELSWTNNKNLPNPESVDIAQAVVDAGSLDSRYLQLSGGTMTGTACEIKKENNVGNLIIRGGTSATDGAYLLLHGGTESTPYPGSFFFRATDGVNHKDFVARPDGILTWAGSNVITAAGGTMTGPFIKNGIIARGSDDSATVNVYGGTGYDNGATIVLSGKSASSNAGQFNIGAYDGTNRKILSGRPDGTLTWNSKSIPERAYGLTLVSTSGSNTYTFEIVDNSAVIFAKRGNNCSCHMVDYWTSGSVKIFATATDPITITKTANNGFVTITNVNNSSVGIKIINGGTL